ncbi:MAG TPA: hypothetical protein PLH50_08410, partial [Ottowia beijingensis]|nr:hypothetical protein [Ottowia beijingensis]
ADMTVKMVVPTLGRREGKVGVVMGRSAILIAGCACQVMVSREKYLKMAIDGRKQLLLLMILGSVEGAGLPAMGPACG